MRKIGKLNGIPIVEGDSNELNRNQIHYKEKEGGNIVLSKIIKGELKPITESSNSSAGGESTGGGAKIIYLNVEAVRDAVISSGVNDAALRSHFCFGAISMKSDYGEGIYDILPFAYPTDDFRKYMIAVAYVDNMKVYDSNGTQMNSSQLIEQYKSMGAYEITEEEFYNLN